jgi:MFS family permease
VWAPVLLITLRLEQGFAVGGEWGGAVLMAVEHAPIGRRGFYGSWPQIGVPAGLLISTVIFGQISKLPEPVFLSWGWRIAFLLSIVLVAVGLFIRLAVVEPPSFAAIKEKRSESRMPILDTIRHHPKNLLLAMGARVADNAVFYIYTAFILAFAQEKALFSRSTTLMAVSIAAAIQIFSLPAYGLLSDIVGRRPVYLFGAIFTALFAFPFFWLIETGNTGLLILSLIVALVIGHAAMYGPQASFFSELFGTRVRYTGASIGYQLSSVVAGGLSPLIATALLKRTGSSWAIALYMIGMATITTISVFLASETAHGEIHEEKPGPLNIESAATPGDYFPDKATVDLISIIEFPVGVALCGHPRVKPSHSGVATISVLTRATPCILKKSSSNDDNLSRDAWIAGQGEAVPPLRLRACLVDELLAHTRCSRSDGI